MMTLVLKLLFRKKVIFQLKNICILENFVLRACWKENITKEWDMLNDTSEC